MPVSPGYRSFVLDQLEQITAVSSKSMFGGVGLYGDGCFFALIADDRLYFKVDDSNRPDFEVAGMEPFGPFDDERSMQYYEVPIQVLEHVDDLRKWATNAIGVAKRAPLRTSRKKRAR